MTPLKTLEKIPDDLETVSYQFLENGLFQVFKNGRILRYSSRGITEPNFHGATRDRGYQVVSGMVDRKQKHFYVHRLIAKAFIPNPENKPCINHIDGNKANNSIENLEWVTYSENTRHGFSTGLIDLYVNAKPCFYCSNKTIAKDNICTPCKRNIKKQKSRLILINNIKQQVEHIDNNLLEENQVKIVNLRKEGKSYREIGRDLSISHQAVEQRINRILREYKRNF